MMCGNEWLVLSTVRVKENLLSLKKGDVSSDQQAAKLLVGIRAHDGKDIGHQARLYG